MNSQDNIVELLERDLYLRAEEIMRWREEIYEQVEQTESGFVELTIHDGHWEHGDKRKVIGTVEVPRAPFVRWALRSQLADYHNGFVWKNVCPLELKMVGDLSDHSDWIVGMRNLKGDLEKITYRLICDAGYDLGFDIERELTNVEIKIFAKGPGGAVTGVCVNVDDPDTDLSTLGEGSYFPGKNFREHPHVLFLPDGSERWHKLFMQKECIGAILNTGGPLCHLATVGRETNKFLLMDPGATQKVRHAWDLVRVDLDEATIRYCIK